MHRLPLDDIDLGIEERGFFSVMLEANPRSVTSA